MSNTFTADLSVIENRLTAARAGYLDNLSAGAVAQAGVYTATRAGYIDNLSAGAVAQAGVYTATRAGYIDNLSAGAAALEATASAIPTSPIKSIQTIDSALTVGSATHDMTISAVVLAKSVVVGQFYNSNLASPINSDDYVGFSFQSTTSLRAQCHQAAAGVNTDYKCFVVEYN